MRSYFPIVAHVVLFQTDTLVYYEIFAVIDGVSLLLQNANAEFYCERR